MSMAGARATLLLALVLVAPAAAADTRTVTGEVIDVVCSTGKGDGGRGEGHAVCAMSCARLGSQMAILTDDAVYVIEGDYTANDNARLLDFVARRVHAKGQVTEKDDGTFAITVASMALAK